MALIVLIVITQTILLIILIIQQIYVEMEYYRFLKPVMMGISII